MGIESHADSPDYRETTYDQVAAPPSNEQVEQARRKRGCGQTDAPGHPVDTQGHSPVSHSKRDETHPGRMVNASEQPNNGKGQHEFKPGSRCGGDEGTDSSAQKEKDQALSVSKPVSKKPPGKCGQTEEKIHEKPEFQDSRKSQLQGKHQRDSHGREDDFIKMKQEMRYECEDEDLPLVFPAGSISK